MRLMVGACLLIAIVFPVLLSLPNAVPALSAADEPLDYDVPDGHFYSQANGLGGSPTLGFVILDDSNARLWSEFRRLGGVDVLGYPASQRFTWDGFVSQVTQRVVLQRQPGLGQVTFVNVFDRLHDLGRDTRLEAMFQVPKQADWSSDTGKSWDQIASAHLALLESSPAIKAKYYDVAGDPIQMNGLPMAPIADRGDVLVLRAQRIVIQQWKKDVPWARAGEVTVALGGDLAKQLGLVPDKLAMVPAPVPASPTPTASPASSSR